MSYCLKLNAAVSCMSFGNSEQNSKCRDRLSQFRPCFKLFFNFDHPSHAGQAGENVLAQLTAVDVVLPGPLDSLAHRNFADSQ